MAETKTKLLLDLDTLTERARVRIDGKTYELRNPGELSLVDGHRLEVRALAIQEAMRRREDERQPDSVEELEEVSRGLDVIVRAVIVDLEPEVLARLGDLHKWAIANAFFEFLTAKGATPAEEDSARSSDSTGVS